MPLLSRLYHWCVSSPLWQRSSLYRHQAPFVLLFTLITTIYAIFMMTILGSKCYMIPNLKHLFTNTLTTLYSHNIDAFLDFGSLLGAIREGSMIPYEFDIDIGIKLEQCTQLQFLPPPTYQPTLLDYINPQHTQQCINNTFHYYFQLPHTL